MLKWLVTKTPPSPTPLENVVTDDPLATLARRGNKREPIYAVSRVNPIFEEDGKEFETDQHKEINTDDTSDSKLCCKDLPESPTTDRESVRSSGYGSKEADAESVSLNSDFNDDDAGATKDSATQRNKPRIPSTKTPSDFDTRDFMEKESLVTVADIRRSFENLSSQAQLSSNSESSTKPKQVAVISKNPNYVKDIEISHHKSIPLEVIPEIHQEGDSESFSRKSSWPKVTHLAQALQKQTDKMSQRREKDRLKRLGREYELSNINYSNNKSQVLRFHPLVSVVAQNEQYVTSISLSPNNKAHPETNFTKECNINAGKHHSNSKRTSFYSESHLENNLPPHYFSNKYTNNEYPLLSLQPDSLVNEDTLMMMKYPDLQNYEHHVDADYQENFTLNNIPRFGKALYSGLYSSLSGSSASHGSLGSGKRLYSNRGSFKKKGVNVVKDLWEKTGLKTNGRKLLVDVTDQINEDRLMGHSRRSSYGSTEGNRSLHSAFANDAGHFRRMNDNVHNLNQRNSDIYDHTMTTAFPVATSSSHSYEEIPDSFRGLDNFAYVDDKGNLRDSVPSSLHSKSSHQFQHSLTEFQRRVSERLRGEPDHRTIWIDLEKGESVEDRDEQDQINDNPNTKKSKKAKKNNKTFPGNAVRQLGLEIPGNIYRENISQPNESPWIVSSYSSVNVNTNPSGSYGKSNRMQIWDRFNSRHKKGTFAGYFHPHPNSEAPIFAQSGSNHDFTLDAKRSHRILQDSSRMKRRRRCCIGALVILAFVVFIGTVIGISWYSTDGERIFGPI